MGMGLQEGRGHLRAQEQLSGDQGRQPHAAMLGEVTKCQWQHRVPRVWVSERPACFALAHWEGRLEPGAAEG